MDYDIQNPFEAKLMGWLETATIFFLGLVIGLMAGYAWAFYHHNIGG